MSIAQEPRALPPHATHEVENQVPPLAGWNVFASDRASTSVHAALYTIGVDGRYRRRLPLSAAPP